MKQPPTKPIGMPLSEWLQHPDFLAWHAALQAVPVVPNQKNHVKARTILWLSGCSYRQIALFYHGSTVITREAIRNSVRRGRTEADNRQLGPGLSDADSVAHCELLKENPHLLDVSVREAALQLIKLSNLQQDR